MPSSTPPLRGLPQTFGVLSIDVEDEDVRILKALMQTDARPRLIVIEIISPGIDDRFTQIKQIADVITPHGYSFLKVMGKDALFVSSPPLSA